MKYSTKILIFSILSTLFWIIGKGISSDKASFDLPIIISFLPSIYIIFIHPHVIKKMKKNKKRTVK